MPPANSPNDSPPSASEETSPYLRQLEAISSPVPDFAATLMTPDEQEINDANVSFLRTRIPAAVDEEPAASEFGDYNTLLDWYNRANDRPEGARTRSVQESYMASSRPPASRPIRPYRPPYWLTRQMEMSRHSGTNTNDRETNYANRTPQRQSLYDWAPYIPVTDDLPSDGREEGAEDADDDLPSYASYARYRWLERRQHYEQNRNEPTPPRNSRQPRDEPSGRTTLSTLSEALRRETTSGRNESLSSTHSLLQSVDRQRRTQSRTHARVAWQMYANNAESRDEDSYTYPYFTAGNSALRQKFLEDPSLMRVREVFGYLSELRNCTSPEESLDLRKQHYLCDPEADTSDQTVLQDLEFEGPTASSWLVPGATFRGTQSAALPSDDAAVFVHQPNRRNAWQRGGSASQDNQRSSELTGLAVTTTSGRRYVADQFWDSDSTPRHTRDSLSVDPDSDEPNMWPVCVTLDTLDLDQMTLRGTMSASKIRDKRSPTGESSSTTYFEGEILDFKTHSFLTENFESEGLETDVMYWVRIGPFKHMDESEIAQKLMQKHWVENVLMRNWILMRWKERSFVPPTPSPNPGGISIRGFYYIALNRQTGAIDGSYGNHPESQPYQRLMLRPNDGYAEEEESTPLEHLISTRKSGMSRSGLRNSISRRSLYSGAQDVIAVRKYFPSYGFR